MRADWVGGFTGRFELPKPDGGRPPSLTFPCASQTRELLPARWAEELPIVPLGVRAAFGIADGGRFCDSSRFRGDTADVFAMVDGRPFNAVQSLTAPFGVAVPILTAPFAVRFAAPFIAMA